LPDIQKQTIMLRFKTVAFLALSAVLYAGCETSVSDLGPCDCEETRTITRTTTLNASNPSVTLSTYNEDGGFTADASCPAVMQVHFRWADPVMASSDEQPCIDCAFESVMGYFSHPNLALPTGSATDGWRWRWQVIEAVNADRPEATSYSIRCTTDAACQVQGDVIVDYFLEYKVFDAEVHGGARPCVP
jgi:hypothetical protein